MTTPLTKEALETFDKAKVEYEREIHHLSADVRALMITVKQDVDTKELQRIERLLRGTP